MILVSNRRTIAQGMRRCSRCGEIKPYAEFHRNRRRRDGMQNNCISCRAVIDRDSYERRRGAWKPKRTWEHGRRAWLLSLKTGNRAPTAQGSFRHGSCSGITCLAIRSWETSALSEVGLDKKFLRRSQNVSWCVRIATPCAHSRGRVGPSRGLNATGTGGVQFGRRSSTDERLASEADSRKRCCQRWW